MKCWTKSMAFWEVMWKLLSLYPERRGELMLIMLCGVHLHARAWPMRARKLRAPETRLPRAWR